MANEPSSSEKMGDVQVIMPPMWPDSIQAMVRLDRRSRIVDPRKASFLNESSEFGQLWPKENTFADSTHFEELLDRSGSGVSHQTSLFRLYEDRQNNAVQLLRQQLDTLNMQRLEAERRQIQIMEESLYEPPSMYMSEVSMANDESPHFESYFGGDDGPASWSSVAPSDSCTSEMEASMGSEASADYWRERARGYAKLLTESIRREEVLIEKLSECTSLPCASQPLEELRQQLHRFDNFLRFTLRKAPVVIAHQDSDLRYRFIYNAFPTLTEAEVIGKTDVEIYNGTGVAELMDFKHEVLRKGCPEKREITFNTDLFGEKTFLIAVEPVLSRGGEAMGLNYIAMDVSEQVDKREKLARLREQVAVQKAMETELHKTIHITEETMRAKQMLATMSHEIRSPLSGVVSMAEVLATTELDEEQRQLVDVMVSSGDLVLQLINDILDLSKVQSGVMKFEAKKFRPQEVVKHVLHLALASLHNKNLVLEGRIYDDVPLELIGDVLRIRQVFTNLVSNAIKFTHEGGMSINLRIVTSTLAPVDGAAKNAYLPARNHPSMASTPSAAGSEESSLYSSRPKFVTALQEEVGCNTWPPSPDMKSRLISQQSAPAGPSTSRDLELDQGGTEDVVWLRCDVCDTGIGIPESALPTLFDKYTQVSTTHARKYGGTGLGLAICKNLIELMGGSLMVSSEENHGSTFSFEVPLRVAPECLQSTGQLSEEVYDKMTNEAKREGGTEKLVSTNKVGYLHYTSKVALLTTSKSSGELNPGSFSNATADSLTSSTAASSSSKQHLEKAASLDLSPYSKDPLHEAKILATRQRPSGVGNSQYSSSEFMDVNLRALDYKAYIPGLSMSQCESPGPFILKTMEGYNSSIKSKAQSPPGLGSSRKVGKSNVPKVPVLNTPSMQHQRPPRILLAEDNKVNVMVAQSMLKRLGLKLEVVSNGAEALEAVQQHSYDVILMDVCMPVMDGLEATRRIRRYEQTGSWEVPKEGQAEKNPGDCDKEFPPDVRFANTAPPQIPMRPRVPIIAMTANALADNMLECFTHGMDSFIAKPVTFTKLEQVLKQFIPCLDRTQSSSSQLIADG